MTDEQAKFEAALADSFKQLELGVIDWCLEYSGIAKKFMTDNTPQSFPNYQPPTVATPPSVKPKSTVGQVPKPLMKLMTRALRGKRSQSIFAPKHVKRKRARVV